MAGILAGYRRTIGTDADDPRFVQLVGEVSLSSERFRQLWARHDIKATDSSERLALLASLCSSAEESRPREPERR